MTRPPVRAGHAARGSIAATQVTDGLGRLPRACAPPGRTLSPASRPALDSPGGVGNDDGVRFARLAVAALLAAVLAGCSGGGPELSPEAERGRQVYLAQCTACHASDPARDGPLGPAVKGSSRELLETRLIRGTYPPGYTPKRPSAVMQPMPHLRDRLDDLAAYLR